MARGTDVTKADGDLRMVNLVKAYGDFRAVDDLTLTIPQGSFFALLGPSGCGKTTTLRMVAGLDEPTSGQILLGDADITFAKPYKRPVNTVFQNYALFPHLTILENVEFGLKRRGVKDAANPAMEALELVELQDTANRKPAQLSGGQQQRIALARAIVNRPSVLLLDEPLGALDLKLRRQMQLELKRIQTEVGLTFVHVTHDQEEAMTMADTVAVMNQGVIEQMGSPTELYEHPRTAFVANFLGQSNLFPATVISADSEMLRLQDNQGKFLVPLSRLSPDASATPGSQVLVGIRPEKITITRMSDAEHPPEHGNWADGVVTDAAFTGVSTQYVVATPGQDIVVFAQNLDSGVIPAQTPVRLTWAAEHAFVLDGRQDVDAGLVIDPELTPAG